MTRRSRFDHVAEARMRPIVDRSLRPDHARARPWPPRGHGIDTGPWVATAETYALADGRRNWRHSSPRLATSVSLSSNICPHNTGLMGACRAVIIGQRLLCRFHRLTGFAAPDALAALRFECGGGVRRDGLRSSIETANVVGVLADSCPYRSVVFAAFADEGPPCSRAPTSIPSSTRACRPASTGTFPRLNKTLKEAGDES